MCRLAVALTSTASVCQALSLWSFSSCFLDQKLERCPPTSTIWPGLPRSATTLRHTFSLHCVSRSHPPCFLNPPLRLLHPTSDRIHPSGFFFFFSDRSSQICFEESFWKRKAESRPHSHHRRYRGVGVRKDTSYASAQEASVHLT